MYQRQEIVNVFTEWLHTPTYVNTHVFFLNSSIIHDRKASVQYSPEHKSHGIPVRRSDIVLGTISSFSIQIVTLFWNICPPLDKRDRVETISATLHTFSQAPFSQAWCFMGRGDWVKGLKFLPVHRLINNFHSRFALRSKRRNSFGTQALQERATVLFFLIKYWMTSLITAVAPLGGKCCKY